MPTNKTSGPAIILVKPQLGENIGKAARAMLNFGLDDLRLVDPRDGWPNPSAGPSAAGADEVLDNAKIFKTTGDAVADLTHVFATTVRSRDMSKPVVSAAQAAANIHKLESSKAGILFGREASGLSNDDIVLADAILTVPVNPDFTSLNLAVAVGVIAYEFFDGTAADTKAPDEAGEGPATKEELIGLFEHFEKELESRGFYHPIERKAARVQTLRNLLQAANLDKQQVHTLRGVIKALTRDTRK